VSTTPSFRSVAEARLAAERALPHSIFDYVEGAAQDELTYAANEAAFQAVTFRPRVAIDVGTPNLETTVLGMPVSIPVLLAPCGLIQTMHADGCLGALRGAHTAGTIAVLSTFGGISPEAAAKEPGPRWFQLYATDREAGDALVQRAKDANFDALVVTLDSPTGGNRERDLRNNAASALQLNLRTVARFAPEVARKPAWLVRNLRNTVTTLRKADTPVASLGIDEESLDPMAPKPVSPGGRVSPFSWDDLRRIREQWKGPMALKGILTAEDAVRAIDLGVEGIIVSNHGGRQLDGAPATMTVLPEVVEAVAGRGEVLVDGGVRRGGDVLRAMALGARAVLIGRPYVYGLGVGGQAGVERVLKVFRREMSRDMVLMGCERVTDLDPTWVRRPS